MIRRIFELLGRVEVYRAYQRVERYHRAKLDSILHWVQSSQACLGTGEYSYEGRICHYSYPNRQIGLIYCCEVDYSMGQIHWMSSLQVNSLERWHSVLFTEVEVFLLKVLAFEFLIYVFGRHHF